MKKITIKSCVALHYTDYIRIQSYNYSYTYEINLARTIRYSRQIKFQEELIVVLTT